MKPRLLDLFCCAGGAARGYQLAGFHVTGIDIKPQPRYIGDVFIQADALEYVAKHGHEYDVINSSPPCEYYAPPTKQWRKLGRHYPDLIAKTREALQATGKPYIIENVPEAPLRNPTILSAELFGLNIARVRAFETSFPLPFVLLPPPRKPVKMGRPVKEGDVVFPVGHFSGVDYVRQQTGCYWMNQTELAEAIPPAMTQWIGERILEQVLV